MARIVPLFFHLRNGNVTKIQKSIFVTFSPQHVKAAPYLKIITMPPFTVSLNTPPAAENAYGTSA